MIASLPVLLPLFLLISAVQNEGREEKGPGRSQLTRVFDGKPLALR